jgi:NAD(P)-dependent dehydrogenase (short-subunit alcohol dehydrogenase family)
VEITDSAARKTAFKEAADKFGKLDIVFANAGIPGNTPAGKTSEDLFRQIIDINLTSVFFTVEDSLPYLNDGASIILNGSVIGTLGQPGYAAYAATKAGVRALARSLAGDLSPRGIRVNVVAPGATKTPIWSRNASRSEEQVSGLENQPLDTHRPGTDGRGLGHIEGRSLSRLRRLIVRAGRRALRRWRAYRNSVRRPESACLIHT